MLQEKDVDRVKRLYEKLRNRKALAKVLGVSENHVKSFIRKYKLNIYEAGEKRKIIPKEELEELYQKLTIAQIATKLDVCKDAVASWFKYYDIEIDTSAGKGMRLSFEEKEILTGALLGDGNLGADNIFTFCHSEKQLDYLQWKKQKMSRLFGDRLYKRDDGYIRYSVKSFALKEFKMWRDTWYPNGIRILPNKWDMYFTPLALAILFFDDGSKHSSGKSGLIHVMNFTLEEVEKICKSMYERFNLNVYPVENNKTRQPEQYSIYVPAKKDSFKTLSGIVEPFCVDCMRYKLFQGVTTKRKAPKRFKKIAR